MRERGDTRGGVAGRARVSRRPPVDTLAKRRGRPATAAALIYRELRGEILSLHRRPSDAIIEKDIAQRFGVSRTPVREALLQLAAEGLVDLFSQSGTFVSRIPLAALPEAIIIRKSLEETAVRLAAENASRSQILGLHTIMERMRETAALDDQDRFHQADEAFHAGLAEAGGYPGIWSFVQQAKLQVDRYRRLTLPQQGRMARVIDEHGQILTAVESRNADRAALLMGQHLGALQTDLADMRHLNPDYFVDHLRPA